MTVSTKSLVFVSAAVALLTVTSSALAQDGTVPPPPASPPPVGGSLGFFGERGQIVISGEDMQLNFTRTSGTMGASTSTTVLIQPAIDYFVSPNFSVGGVLGYASGSQDAGMTTLDISAVTIAARAGYNLVLSNAVSLWVRGGLGYVHVSSEFGGASQSGYQIPLFIFAPVLWHPASHFFVGAGPAFSTDLASSVEDMDASKSTSIGISSTVGGYFGGL